MTCITLITHRDVSETFAYEIETRLRHSVFSPKRDQDQDLPAIPRDRYETRRLIFATRWDRDRDVARPRPRRFSRPSTFSIVPKQWMAMY